MKSISLSLLFLLLPSLAQGQDLDLIRSHAELIESLSENPKERWSKQRFADINLLAREIQAELPVVEPVWVGSITAGVNGGQPLRFGDGTRVKWWSKNWYGHAELWYDETRTNADATWTEPGHCLATIGVDYPPTLIGAIPQTASVSWDATVTNGNDRKNYLDMCYFWVADNPSWTSGTKQHEIYFVREYSGTPGDTRRGSYSQDGTNWGVWQGQFPNGTNSNRLKFVYESGAYPESIRIRPAIDHLISLGYVQGNQYIHGMNVGCECHNAQNGMWQGRNIQMWRP